MREYEIVVLGGPGVGKTSLTLRFVHSFFKYVYNPSFETSYKKIIEVDGEQCALNIVDMSGAEQFGTMSDYFMKTGQSFVIVYAIDDIWTFSSIESIPEKIHRLKETVNVPMVIVGNKCDLAKERAVSKDAGQSLADKFECTFMETSAKKTINVHQVFCDLVRQINKLPRKEVEDKPRESCDIM